MIGKVNDDFFRRAILPHTGAHSPHVVVGPKMGVDAAVLKFGEEYLVVAEDPIFPGPTTSPEDYGWITVHIGASDVAVLGVKPGFMTYTLLLPPGTLDDYTERLVRSISDCARELGIAVVGGHTGFYGAVVVPTIGGITVWGTGREVITPGGAREGDVVVLTKGAAIEAAGILASELGERLLAAGVGPDLVDRARLRFKEMSVVADAEVATRAGGVHAMHDATEGGVARGLWEVAEASGAGLEIDRAKVPVPADVAAVCDHFGLDPYEVISEGTLVLTCDPARAENLLEAFRSHGIEAAVCGRVVPAGSGRWWIGDDGRREPLTPPPVDRFWEVFFNALALKSDTRTPAERTLCEELAEAVKALERAGILPLIPEIGANIAYASLEARETRDVAAIPGRLVRVKDRVVPTGQPEMGASIYMAGTLLIAREFFPDTRCVMNLRNNPRVLGACAKAGLVVAAMPAPPDYRQSDDDYSRDLRAVLAARSTLPDVVDVPDRINLERLILVFATGLDDLLRKVKAIAERLG
ncbi:MAG: AIR synthase [Firmicutes bacterium]|nr:AIR synthase [Bacillota bacterium]